MSKIKQHERKRPIHLPKHRAKQRAVRIEHRRVQVAELLLQGKTYREMADMVGVKSTQTVFEDVNAILAEWQRQQQHAVTEWKALELERVGRVESQAWDAWERSQEDAEIETTERGARKKITLTRHTAKGQVGDPRFLDVIIKCVTRRCELLGLDEPKEINVPGLLAPDEIEKRRKDRWNKVLPAITSTLALQSNESVSNA